MKGLAYCEASGKIQYETRFGADTVVKRMRHRRGELSVYRCKFCWEYHIGRDRDLRVAKRNAAA